MKIKNIVFYGVMSYILSVAGANAAATQETIIASKNYVDTKIQTDINAASGNYATKEQGEKADTALQKADIKTGTSNGRINVQGTDVAVKGLGSAAYKATSAFEASGAAAAARTNAVADVKANLENTTPVYDINAKSLKVNGVDVITEHVDVSNKADTNLGNITDAGKTVIQNEAKSVSAEGEFNTATNYANNTVGAAIKSKADSSALADKANASDLATHTANTTVHITAAERTAWNAKQNAITSTNKLSAANVSGLATVATSGSYDDLKNKPTIPAAQVQSDWNATSGMGAILNKPTLGTVAEKAVTTTQRTATTGTNAATDANVPTEKAVATALAGKANTSALNNKQDKLTTDQLAAVNSGITSEKVSTYDGFSTSINNKADKGNVTAATGNNLVSYNDQGIVTGGTAAGALATKDSVTSADITNNTIVNADISTAANIAYTKMAAPTIGINTGETGITCSSAAPCVLSFDGSAYSWTRFVY